MQSLGFLMFMISSPRHRLSFTEWSGRLPEVRTTPTRVGSQWTLAKPCHLWCNHLARSRCPCVCMCKFLATGCIPALKGQRACKIQILDWILQNQKSKEFLRLQSMMTIGVALGMNWWPGQQQASGTSPPLSALFEKI